MALSINNTVVQAENDAIASDRLGDRPRACPGTPSMLSLCHIRSLATFLPKCG
jgi:hypothetical protein